MITTFSGRIGRRGAVVAVAAAVVAVVTGCSAGGGIANTVAADPASSSPSAALSVPSSLPVVLRFGDHAVVATLAGTTAATELAAMLPLRVTLTDAWRQAKSGRLPHPVAVENVARTLRPVAGGIYYWPDTTAIAVYYDDLGQSVPPPGLIRLGTVDTGLDEIGAAGRQVTVHIDRVAGTGV
ncbi:MAG TPA: cyclophilin-like fold protein [Lapillicoccus sp.]